MLLYVTLHYAKIVFRAAEEGGLSDHFVWVGADGWGSRFIPPVHRSSFSFGGQDAGIRDGHSCPIPFSFCTGPLPGREKG